MILEKRRRHLERYIEIGRVLARHQWEHLLTQVGLADLFHLRHHGRGLMPDPIDVRESLEELGPTFIKLGQILSTRPDLIPPRYIEELEKLQDTAPTVPTDEMLKIIEEEFGAPVHSVFDEFQEAPMAAASLGQTYLAKLTGGTPVVVKVQRPGIRRQIDTDLEIMYGIARFLEQRWEKARIYNLVDLVEEFSITIHQELDYTHEGRSTDRIREELEDEKYVRVPVVHWDYTTSKVLTTERITGIKITDIAQLDELGFDKHAIAHNLTCAYMDMIFVQGLFHADPHPGNLVVIGDDTVGILDYGIVGSLDRNLRREVTILLEEYIEQDSRAFADQLLRMGETPPDLKRRDYEAEIDRTLRQYYGAPLAQVNVGELLQKALRISAKYRVRIPSSLALLVKVLIGVDGIDRLLDPRFDFAAAARPYVNKSIRNEFSFSEMADQAYRSLVHLKKFILAFPERAADLLDRMNEGAFKIVFKHEGLEAFTRNVDKSMNRLSFALVASATIVASALVLVSKVGPIWRGYPIIGILGFAVSFVFAAWLMISILRAGKMW